MKFARLVCIALSGAALQLSVYADGIDEPALKRATAEAGKLIDEARKAKPKSKDAKIAVKEAYAKLEPFEKEVRRLYEKEKGITKASSAFAQRFNELLTTAEMHGVRPRADYICWTRTLARKRLRVELPVSSHWTLRYERGTQHVATLKQTRPNGKPLREIKVWRYKWDTVYSGVGGENCRKLAEVILELDREEAKLAGGKASSKVYVRKLNREFKRAYWYKVEMYDSKLDAKIRRREMYIKGKSATFNFEILEHISAQKTDDHVTRFQIENDGVELMHLLESLELTW